MALLYKFPAAKIISKWNEAKSGARVAEIQKAVLKATNDAHTTKFIKAFMGLDIQTFLQTAHAYVSKNMVAKGLVPVKAQPSVAEQILIKAIFGPQQAVLLAKFDLSIHLKNGAVEVQGTDCKGASKVLLAVKP